MLKIKNILFILLLRTLVCVQGESENPTTRLDLEVDLTTNSPLALQQQLQTLTPIGSESEVKPLKILNELSTLGHGVRSGNVQILDEKTIFIPEFYFDGNALDTHFLAGKGDQVTEEGTFVPLQDGTEDAINAYNGQDVTLVLPGNLTINDIDWLAVWCKSFNLNLGSVFLNEEKLQRVSPYPPQIFGLESEVTSGPIVLVNKKTLFIPNFRYKGDHDDVHFWVGNGTEPTSSGLMVPDENGLNTPIHPYQGKNIYITLPNGVTTDNIEYFGVWSTSEEHNLGHVILNKENPVPETSPQTTKDFVMRLPKCCSTFSMLTRSGCEERNVPEFKPQFNIYEHNETHINNISLNVSSIDFQPYVYSMKCPSSAKYHLDAASENFGILQNGSLIVKGAGIMGILSQGEFCAEYIENDTDMYIFVCAPEFKINHAMFHAYLILTITSTFCFAGAFFLYYFILQFSDVHRKCFIFYSFWMCVTFICLIVVQVAYIENKGCEVIGFFFQLSMISSFTWLAILCFDVAFIIRYFEDNTRRGKRMLSYLIIGFSIPILSLIISLARNLTPDVPNSFFKPQYGRNTCYFEAENQRLVYFYVPIIITIVVSAVCLGYSKFMIIKNDRKLTMRENYFWRDKSQNFSFMLRQCLMTWVIMTICWISDVLMSFLDDSSGFFNTTIIVEALQGVFIVAVFTMHHLGSVYLEQNRNLNPNPENAVEMNRLCA